MSIKELLTRILNALKVDYIIEEGTYGIWQYIKWNSGMSECWGTVFGNTTNGASIVDFPSGLFYNNDPRHFNVQATLYYGESDNPNRSARPLMPTDGSSSTQCVIFMRTTSNTAYSGYYGLRLSAKGRWK